MEIKNKNILVIGGAGFIGSFVVKELLKENVNKVVIYDNFTRGKIEYLTKSTSGDKDLKTPLSKMSSAGVFTDDLRKNLIQNKCDIIV